MDLEPYEAWSEAEAVSRCYHCGSKTRGGFCSKCDIGDGYAAQPKPEDVGFYATGWLWDFDEPELQHKALHRFGPYLTEAEAQRILENLEPPVEGSDIYPQVYEVKRIELMPALEVSAEGRYLIPAVRGRMLHRRRT